MPPWETQGSHRFYREADLLVLEIHGMFTLADTQHMYAANALTEQAYGYVLTLFDARDASGISADARRYVGDQARERVAPGASAIVGASFPLRAVVNLIRNASRLIGRPMPPMSFCATPADGIQWLATQRLQFQATRAGKRS